MIKAKAWVDNVQWNKHDATEFGITVETMPVRFAGKRAQEMRGSLTIRGVDLEIGQELLIEISKADQGTES